MKTNFFSQRGQGLIETLIVVLFIAISVVALIKFQVYLSASSNLAQQQADATLLAVNQIENVRQFVVVNTTTGFAAYQDIASSSKTQTVGNTAYTLTWTVTTTTNPNYKNINMVVSWTDRFGAAQSITLVTRIAGIDPGISGSFM